MQNSIIKYPEKLSEIPRFVLKISEQLKNNLIAVVLSGSASRDDDYVEGWSDIDLTIIVKDLSKITNICIDKPHHKVFLSLSKYKRECKNRTIYAYLLNKGAIIYNNGIFKLEKAKIPNDIYRYVVLDSVFVAFRLREYKNTVQKKVRQLYHSLRHLIRFIDLKYGNFPLSDRELCESFEYIKHEKFKNLFNKILNCKYKKKITLKEYLKLEKDTKKILINVLLESKSI